jgi:hypothetical protein
VQVAAWGIGTIIAFEARALGRHRKKSKKMKNFGEVFQNYFTSKNC